MTVYLRVIACREISACPPQLRQGPPEGPPPRGGGPSFADQCTLTVPWATAPEPGLRTPFCHSATSSGARCTTTRLPSSATPCTHALEAFCPYATNACTWRRTPSAPRQLSSPFTPPPSPCTFPDNRA